MATLTDNDLQELKSFLGEQFKQINDKTDKLSEDVNGKINKLSEDVNSKINNLSEDVNGKINNLSEDVNGKIDKLSEDVNGKIDNLSEDVNNLRVDFANIKGELTGTNKRLENIEFTNRTIFVAIVAALIAGVVKLFFPSLPNSL